MNMSPLLYRFLDTGQQARLALILTSASGPSETSGDVRYCAAIGGQAEIRRAGLKYPDS